MGSDTPDLARISGSPDTQLMGVRKPFLGGSRAARMMGVWKLWKPSGNPNDGCLETLTEADKTELTLKHSEIRKFRSQPEKATILADEKAELAIMKAKMAKLTELQSVIEQAQRGQPGADQRVADLVLAISHDELNLKKQQVVTLQDQIEIRRPDKQPALLKLLEGERYEVAQLKQIQALNREIAYQVRSGGYAAELADLRRRVVHHELLMKEQNERQLEARLTPDSGA